MTTNNGGYGFGVKNKEWEMILEFCKAMNVAVGNILCYVIHYVISLLYQNLRSIIIW